VSFFLLHFPPPRKLQDWPFTRRGSERKRVSERSIERVAMAGHLGSIFATEKDRVNCPFYFKIGACRHGERCSRIHNKPPVSQCVLFKGMYQSPVQKCVAVGSAPPSRREASDHFEDFYEDVFEELVKFGELKEMHICDNMAEHLSGNVYALFRDERDAKSALEALNGRYYEGKTIAAEFSPVTDFRDASCRQYAENECSRGGYCNFMHLRQIGRSLSKELYGRFSKSSKSRSSRERSRSFSPSRRRGGGKDGDEGDRERRAKIARWNRERAEKLKDTKANTNAADNKTGAGAGDDADGGAIVHDANAKKAKDNKYEEEAANADA
jgi:splicing factor U2AF subunit